MTTFNIPKAPPQPSKPSDPSKAPDRNHLDPKPVIGDPPPPREPTASGNRGDRSRPESKDEANPKPSPSSQAPQSRDQTAVVAQPSRHQSEGGKPTPVPVKK